MGGEKGFTYMALLVSLFIIGVSMAVVGPSLRLQAKREREAELIWRGNQFILAIKRYNAAAQEHLKQVVPPGTPLPNIFPAQLKDLIDDPLHAQKQRYIRKIYTDPMTGKDDWVLLMDEKQRIRGVHSKSDGETLKRDNFDLIDYKFKGKTRYSEWEFVYDPNDPIANGMGATVYNTGATK